MLKEKAGTYPVLNLLLALSGLNREDGSQRALPLHTHTSLSAQTHFSSLHCSALRFSSLLHLLPALHFITFISLCLFPSLLSRSPLFSSFPLPLLSLLMSTLPALFESLICVRLDSKQFTCINSFYSSQLPTLLFIFTCFTDATIEAIERMAQEVK